MKGRAFRRSVLAGAACLGLTPPAAAQDNGGGQLLTIGLSQRLSYESNPDLVSGSDGDGAFIGLTDLSFAFTDTTRTDRFSVTGSTGLRLGDTDAPTVATPGFGFSYGRESADATLDLSGSWSRSEIDRLATLADFTDEDGTITLPVDFDLLDPTIDGTRTATAVRIGFTGGRTGPLGYSLSAGLNRISYDGQAARTLSDSQTLSLGGGLNLRLDEVTRASLSLSYTRFEDEGADPTDRLGASASWRRDNPGGGLGFSLSARETDAGTRYGAETSRTYETPRTQLTFGVGLSRIADGDWSVTGRVNARYALPDDAALNFGAQRSFAAAADGTDRSVTDLSAGYSTPLTPLSQIESRFSYLEVDEADGQVRTLNLSASYSHRLTEDWSLSTGVTLTERRETGLERARNESVFLSLNRSFTYRP